MPIAITRTRADLNAPVPSPAAGGNILQCLYSIIDITTTATATNTVDVGYLPKGAIPIGGYFASVDLDTGTGVLDMDLGITANGVDVADPDFFMNGGAFTGAAITDMPLTNGACYRPLIGPFPVTQLGAKTLVQMLTNTAANAGGVGKFAVCIHYIMPGTATS